MARTIKTAFGRVRTFFSILDGARSAAAALESGRKPSAQALQQLGLDARMFDGIRLR